MSIYFCIDLAIHGYIISEYYRLYPQFQRVHSMTLLFALFSSLFLRIFLYCNRYDLCHRPFDWYDVATLHTSIVLTCISSTAYCPSWNNFVLRSVTDFREAHHF